MLQRFAAYLDNTRSIQLFQVLRFGAQFLVNILLAKTYLSLDEIGTFDTFLFIATSLSFFWISGIINSLLSIYPRKSADEQPALLFNAALLIVMVNTLVCVALYLFSGPILNLLYPERDFPYLAALFLFLFLNNPSFLLEYVLFLKNKTMQVATYGVVVLVLQLLAVGVPVFFGYGIDGAIAGMIAFAAIKLIMLIVVLMQHSKASVDKAFLKQHGRVAFPLGLSILISGAGDIIGSAFVRVNFDSASFAIFRYGAREFPIALLLANAFSTAAISHVATDLNESLGYIKERSRQMMHVLFPFTIVLVLTSKMIYPFLFRPDFLAGAPIFNIYLLLIITRLIFPQTILNGLQQTRPILLSACMEIVIILVLSPFFIRWFGMEGVAYAAVTAYLMDKAVLILYNHSHNGIKLSAYTDLKVWLGYSVLLLGAYGVSLFLL